jgi:hypothetical protein
MHIYGKAVASIQESNSEENPHGGFTAVLSTPSLDRDGDKLHRDEWMGLPERLPLDVDHGMTVADTIGSFRPYFDGENLMMDATFASTQKAQEVRTLIKEGHISTVSVAFMTDKSKKDGEPRRELLNAGVVAIPSNRDAVILASKAASALRDAVKAGVTEDDEVEDDDDRTIGEVIAGLFKSGQKPEAKAEETPEKNATVFLDVIPRIDLKLLKSLLGDAESKAIGNEGALLQAIHDASAHLGALCAQLEQEESGETEPKGIDGPTGTFLAGDIRVRSFEDGKVTVIWGDEQKEFTEEELHAGAASEWLKSFIEVHDMSDKKEAFEKALELITETSDDQSDTSQESPAESPEAAAASEEEPAPAPTDKAAESEVTDQERRGRHLELLLFASES